MQCKKNTQTIKKMLIKTAKHSDIHKMFTHFETMSVPLEKMLKNVQKISHNL